MMALGDQRLTTKQLQARLPDVAQASLYRAVSRLVDAGAVEIVDTKKRGGAIERVYSATPLPSGGNSADEAVRAAADVAGKSIVTDACRWLAHDGDHDHVMVRREVLTLAPDDAQAFRRELDALVDRAVASASGAPEGALAFTVAVFPLDREVEA